MHENQTKHVRRVRELDRLAPSHGVAIDSESETPEDPFVAATHGRRRSVTPPNLRSSSPGPIHSSSPPHGVPFEASTSDGLDAIHGPALDTDDADQIYDDWAGNLGYEELECEAVEEVLPESLPDIDYDNDIREPPSDGPIIWDDEQLETESSETVTGEPAHPMVFVLISHCADHEGVEDEKWWPWRNREVSVSTDLSRSCAEPG